MRQRSLIFPVIFASSLRKLPIRFFFSSDESDDEWAVKFRTSFSEMLADEASMIDFDISIAKSNERFLDDLQLISSFPDRSNQICFIFLETSLLGS